MAVFRVEKTRDYTVMSNHHFRNTNLSLKAKGLLSLMLSLPEDWDYTTKGLVRLCKDGRDSVASGLQELEQEGYLTRTRIRLQNGQLGDIEYTIHEKPETPDPTTFRPIPGKPEQVSSAQKKPVFKKPIPENPVQVFPVQENQPQSNTNILNTKESSNLSINPKVKEREKNPSQKRMDEMDRMEDVNAYRDLIKTNIEYNVLTRQYGRERVDELLELMVETVLSRKAFIHVAGGKVPREIVKSRLLKVRFAHVEYMFDCLQKNTSKVKNIKAYLLTSLYNTPTTMNSYYRAEVQHDLHATPSGIQQKCADDLY